MIVWNDRVGVKKSSNLRTVLLIWDEIPEKTTFYLAKVDQPSFKALSACHGYFINASDVPEEVMNTLTRLQARIPLWEKHKLDDSNPIEISGPATVIHTGFLL